MKKDYFRLLADVLIMPDEVYHTGSEEDWAAFEQKENIVFPNDYKAFINRYGTGGLGDFIWFLTPFDQDENVNYCEKASVMLEAYKTSRCNNPDFFNHNVFPEEFGLLPWGYTDNGDELYWKTNTESEHWEIVIYESASPDSYHFPMSLAEFLYKLITKQIQCDVFPDDLFDEPVIYSAVATD